jgi:hypothetical protein
LGNETVQVLVVGSLQTQVAAADVVNSLVVDHEGTIRVLKGGVGGEDGVVWLNNGCGSLGSWVDTELQLAFLAIINGKTLHEEGTETRTSSTTEGVEDKESLETRAVIGNAANFVQNLVDHLLADSVVTTSIVVGSIFLAGDHVLWVEKAAVSTSANLVDNVGLEIAVDSTWNVFSLTFAVINISNCSPLSMIEYLLTSLGEESAEALVRLSCLALLGEISIRLDDQNASATFLS